MYDIKDEDVVGLLTDLPSMPLEQRWSLPGLQCIYFVLSGDGQVLYIGQTRNLHSRWGTHNLYKALKKIPDVHIAWLYVSKQDLLLELEQALINYYQPEFHLNKPVDEQVCLCIKVPRPVRHHWAIEAKKAEVSMTEVMVAALEARFGLPENQKKN